MRSWFLLLLLTFRASNQFQKSFQRQVAATGTARERAAQGCALFYKNMGACLLMR